MTEINFKNGKAEIKNGRKIIAKVYDRKVFFAGTRYENSFSKPFSVEICGMMKECVSLDEVKQTLEKYV